MLITKIKSTVTKTAFSFSLIKYHIMRPSDASAASITANVNAVGTAELVMAAFSDIHASKPWKPVYVG